MYQSFLYNVRLRPVEESGIDHGFKISKNRGQTTVLRLVEMAG